MLDDEADKDMDNNAVDGPTVLAHVELCRTVHKYTIALLGFNLYFFVTDRQLPIADLAMEINQPRLIEHVRQFLYDQLYPDSNLPSSDISLNAYSWDRCLSSCLLLPRTMPQVTPMELGACIVNIFELLLPGDEVLHVMTVFS